MKNKLCLLLALVMVIIHQTSTQQTGKFPDDFAWGVATSSYQIEGAVDEDGRTPSIWDYLTHNTPEKIRDCSNADFTADSYHNYKRDVEMVKELGVEYYRFSISWNRILPQGYSYEVNQKGIDYYNNLIDELIKNGIKPMVTMYHWDLPQRLQELGGWTNPEIINLFVDYARVLINNFGNRVQFWTTFNEPYEVCVPSYNWDGMAPGMDWGGIPVYLCGHNLIKAHAEVYHMYKQMGYTGKMGMTSDCHWQEPKTNSAADKAASEQALQFTYGWWMHPIFKGDYPQVMIDRIGNLSMQQGFSKSRLPKFTPEEITRIRGTGDYLAFNHYSTVYVTSNGAGNPANMREPSYEHDMDKLDSIDPNWSQGVSSWLQIVPWGIYNFLKWLSVEYNNMPIYITENGVSDLGGTKDTVRVDFFNHYLENVLKAYNEGVNVKGYMAWSLLDNFEWRSGYTERFGMYHVDFTSESKTRVAKMSAKVYKKIVETNQIDFEYKPEPEVFIETPTEWISFCKDSASSVKISFMLLVSSILLKFFH